jgi:hypothetical protein
LTILQWRGMKGIPHVDVLKDVDLGEGILVDEMHCVALGVCKKILKLWFTSTKKPYSVDTEKVFSILRLLSLKINFFRLR